MLTSFKTAEPMNGGKREWWIYTTAYNQHLKYENTFRGRKSDQFWILILEEVKLFYHSGVKNSWTRTVHDLMLILCFSIHLTILMKREQESCLHLENEIDKPTKKHKDKRNQINTWDSVYYEV